MKSLREKWRASVVGRSARILSRRDQRRIIAISITQIVLGALDLLGVAAIGALGALAISGIESRQPGNRVSSLLALLKLDGIYGHNILFFRNSTEAIREPIRTRRFHGGK